MCFNKRSSQVFVNECWWSCVWEQNCSRNLGNFTRVLSHKSHLLWIMRLFYFSIARSRLEKRLLFLLVRSKTCARYFHFILASLSVSRTIFFILHSFAHFITEFIYYTIFYSTILLCSVVAAFLLLLCHEHELLTLSQYDYTTFFHLWSFLIIDHITFSCLLLLVLFDWVHLLRIRLFNFFFSHSSPAHLLNWATLGKVCSAEGDSGRMSAQATMLSPFFSTRDLWTTEQAQETCSHSNHHYSKRSSKRVTCEVTGEVNAAVCVNSSFCQAACSLSRRYLPNRTAQRAFQRAGGTLRAKCKKGRLMFAAVWYQLRRRSQQPHHQGHVEGVERSSILAALTVVASPAVDEHRRFCELQREETHFSFNGLAIAAETTPFYDLFQISQLEFPAAGLHLHKQHMCWL